MGLRFKHDKYASEQTEVSSIIYNLEKFSKDFFHLFIFFILFLYYVHFLDTFIPYYNIVHREVDKAFVSSGYLKSQSIFHTHTGRRNPSGPLNNFIPSKNAMTRSV